MYPEKSSAYGHFAEIAKIESAYTADTQQTHINFAQFRNKNKFWAILQYIISKSIYFSCQTQCEWKLS